MPNQEQLRPQEGNDASNVKLEKAIDAYTTLIAKAEEDPNQKTEQQLHDLMNAANNVFRSNPGKWPVGLVENTYTLIKKVGIIAAGYDEATGVKFVRLSAAILLNHLPINDENKPLVHILLYDKTNFNFVREIKYEWLGAKGMAKLEKIGVKLYELAGTLSEGRFSNSFAGLTESGFDAYTDEILGIDPKSEDRTTDARSKILLGLIQYFHSGLIRNPNVSIENKKKVLEFNKIVLDKVPGLFADKRVALAEGVGIGLKDVKGKKRKVLDTRLASERLSQKEHEYVSVESLTPDDVVVFDYKESDEKVLAMPEIMKVQLNSIALIGDLATGYWNHEGGEKGLEQGQFAIQALDNVQKDLVNYYRDPKYDGKTPFKLSERLKAAMSIKAFGEIKNLAYSSRISDVPYRSALLNLVDGKPLADMDEVKKAGLAVAWLQRNKFDDFMSARGLMAKLLHKDVMMARENLPEDVQKKLYGDAYTDASRFMRNLLADGDHMNTFRANFPVVFKNEFGRSPTDAEIDDGAKKHLSALFESQHMFLYDAYLTWAALSRQYIDSSKMAGVDKDIYAEFCKSVDPDGGSFRLDDRAKVTLVPIMREIAIMALSFGAAWAVSAAARGAIGLVRGASLFQKTTTMAKLAKYSAEAAMFTGKVAAEAGAFYDTDAVLHGRETIIGTALEGEGWKASKMLAADMPMFAGLNIVGGLLKFLKMGAEGKVLMKYAAKNTQHAKAIEGIFALAKKSPMKAIEAMKSLIQNGGKLAKGGVLPSEVLESFGRTIQEIELITEQYRGIIEKITDPRIRDIVGKLVIELNFDAAAIVIGEYAKENIRSEDRPKVEATLLNRYKNAYLTAGVFKAVFGGLGKLAEKLPDAVERALPKAMRERIFKSYQNSKGEFIGRDGLVQMLTEGLEGEGFESAIAKIEDANILILTVEDVLLVTSKLTDGKAKKFLQTCKRMMNQAERQLVVDEVKAMQKAPVLPEGFAGGRSEMPMDPLRRETGFIGKMITAKVVGLVLRVFEPDAAIPPTERPAAVVEAKPGDFSEGGRFNLSKDRVAKMPEVSEKTKVALINSGAKNAGESIKDFSEFDFSVSQNSIFEGMAKAGVDIKNINELKAAYAALPAFLQPYYRIFGVNRDGQFVSSVAIDQKFGNDFKSDVFQHNLVTAGWGADLVGFLTTFGSMLPGPLGTFFEKIDKLPDWTKDAWMSIAFIMFVYYIWKDKKLGSSQFFKSLWGPVALAGTLINKALEKAKDAKSHEKGEHKEGHGDKKGEHKAEYKDEAIKGTLDKKFGALEDEKNVAALNKFIGSMRALFKQHFVFEDTDAAQERFDALVKWKFLQLKKIELQAKLEKLNKDFVALNTKIDALSRSLGQNPVFRNNDLDDPDVVDGLITSLASREELSAEEGILLKRLKELRLLRDGFTKEDGTKVESEKSKIITQIGTTQKPGKLAKDIKTVDSALNELPFLSQLSGISKVLNLEGAQKKMIEIFKGEGFFEGEDAKAVKEIVEKWLQSINGSLLRHSPERYGKAIRTAEEKLRLMQKDPRYKRVKAEEEIDRIMHERGHTSPEYLKDALEDNISNAESEIGNTQSRSRTEYENARRILDKSESKVTAVNIDKADRLKTKYEFDRQLVNDVDEYNRANRLIEEYEKYKAISVDKNASDADKAEARRIMGEIGHHNYDDALRFVEKYETAQDFIKDQKKAYLAALALLRLLTRVRNARDIVRDFEKIKELEEVIAKARRILKLLDDLSVDDGNGGRKLEGIKPGDEEFKKEYDHLHDEIEGMKNDKLIAPDLWINNPRTNWHVKLLLLLTLLGGTAVFGGYEVVKHWPSGDKNGEGGEKPDVPPKPSTTTGTGGESIPVKEGGGAADEQSAKDAADQAKSRPKIDPRETPPDKGLRQPQVPVRPVAPTPAPEEAPEAAPAPAQSEGMPPSMKKYKGKILNP